MMVDQQRRVVNTEGRFRKRLCRRLRNTLPRQPEIIGQIPQRPTRER